MDTQLVIKCLVAGLFVSCVIYFANVYGGVIGGFLNAVPLLASIGFVGVMFTTGDSLNFSKGLLIANIPYVFFCISLFMLVSRTNKPLLALCLSIVLFVPVFFLTKIYIAE